MTKLWKGSKCFRHSILSYTALLVGNSFLPGLECDAKIVLMSVVDFEERLNNFLHKPLGEKFLMYLQRHVT